MWTLYKTNSNRNIIPHKKIARIILFNNSNHRLIIENKKHKTKTTFKINTWFNCLCDAIFLVDIILNETNKFSCLFNIE